MTLLRRMFPGIGTRNQQEAFNAIKEQFCTERQILKVYDPELLTRLECDASGFATGGILSQET